MKKIGAKIPWLLSGAAMVALLAYGFWPETVQVDLVQVTRGSLEVTVNDDGETRIREKYIISAPVAGKLLRLQLNVGDQVQQGTTELARIEPSDPALLDARTQAECEARVRAAAATKNQADANLVRANEASELANHNFDRANRLFSQKAISRAEFDVAEHRRHIANTDVRSAEFGVNVAQFELEHARAAVSRFDVNGPTSTVTPIRLISPINGRVLRVFHEDASVVTPGTALLELGDPQDLEIEIDILSSDAVRVQPEDQVYIDHWGGTDMLEAVVRTVEPSAFLKVSALGVEEKRVNVIADFVDPWSVRQSLGDGFRIESRIVVSSTDQKSLKVATGVLFREEDSWFAFRIVDGIAKSSPVQLGETNGIETEIKEGLAEGDVVVLHPTHKIRDGVRVMQNE